MNIGRPDRQVFLSPPRGGKTTAILQWMRDVITEGESTPVLVDYTHDVARTHYHQLHAEGAEVEKWQFITIDQIGRGDLMGRPNRDKIVIGIDNAAMVLQGIMLEYPIRYLTITGLDIHQCGDHDRCDHDDGGRQ